MTETIFNSYISNDLLQELRNEWLESFYMNGDPIRGAAVLEKGYVDLELNIYSFEQCGKDGKKPILGYFCCIKHGETDDTWESYDYIEDPVEVDWNANNWKELLKNDMGKKLEKFVEIKGFHFDEPN